MDVPTRETWLIELDSLRNEFPIRDEKLQYKSPEFRIANWEIAIEHQKHFTSVVLRWVGDGKLPPKISEIWTECTRSEQEKNWQYRVKLEPHQLRSLLFEILKFDAPLMSFEIEFNQRVRESFQEPAETRRTRLQNADKLPRQTQMSTLVFIRNPDVVAEVLVRANGVCERCGMEAPFIRKSDGTPYLEVHHRIPLAQGGEDTVENALAFCPNCHREAHYG